MSYSTHMHGHRDPRSLFQIDRLHACQHGQYFPPAMVEISPTNVCNQKCRYCYSEGRVAGNPQLSNEILVQCMLQLRQAGVDAVCFQGTGEPLLHKGVPAAIRTGAEQGLTIGLTTNGVPLTPGIQEQILPCLHYLKFSALDNDPARYATQHGCDPKQHAILMRNVAAAADMRRRLDLKLALIATVYLTQENVAEAYDIVRYFKEAGLDYINVSEALYLSSSPEQDGFSSPNLSDTALAHLCDRLHSLVDKDFDLTVALKKSDSLPFGPNHETWRPNYCQGIKFVAIIASDGNVYPCYRVWGKPEFSYGNIHEQSFDAIWKGSRRQQVEAFINQTPPRHDECVVCGCIRHNVIHGKLNAATPWRHFL